MKNTGDSSKKFNKTNTLLLIIILLLVIVSYQLGNTEGNNFFEKINRITGFIFFPTHELIYTTSSEHLSVNKQFIEDIYNKTSVQDNIWTEPILENEYVRIKFEKELNSDNDITIHAKSSGVSQIIIYAEDSNTEITRFTEIANEATHKIYLTNLQTPQDTFDFKILGDSVEFDYIIDPTPIELAVPQTFNIHGRLSNSTEVMNGTYQFNFSIYDTYMGGVSLWSTTKLVEVIDGVFYDVVLNVSGLNFVDQYYLGIAIESDSEMSPRMNLTTSPYSFMAQNVYVGGIVFDENLNATGFNVTAEYFLGDGSMLTGIQGDDTSWNKTYADSLYADISVNGDITEIVEGNAITITGGTGPIPSIAVTADSIDSNQIATNGVSTTEILDGTISELDLNLDNAAVDGDILTYDSTGTNFVWQTCAEITGSSTLCDSSDAYNSAYDTEAEIDSAVSNNGYKTSIVSNSATEVTVGPAIFDTVLPAGFYSFAMFQDTGVMAAEKYINGDWRIVYSPPTNDVVAYSEVYVSDGTDLKIRSTWSSNYVIYKRYN